MLDEILRYRKAFEDHKNFVHSILTDKHAYFPNEAKVDAGIIDLVMAIDALPFASTFCSCSSHFFTREDIFKKAGHRDESLLVIPYEGYGMYFSGYIGLVFGQDALSRNLISDYEAIVMKYGDAYIETWSPLIPVASKELSGLRFEIHLDNAKPHYGMPAIFEISQGQSRLQNVNSLIEDLLKKALEYTQF